MTNMRPYRDSNMVPPGYKPKSIRMSHRGRSDKLSVYSSVLYGAMQRQTAVAAYMAYLKKQLMLFGFVI